MPPRIRRTPAETTRQIRRLQDQFDEFLAQIEAELTPEQADRINALREKNRQTRRLLPGPNCEILPDSN